MRKFSYANFHKVKRSFKGKGRCVLFYVMQVLKGIITDEDKLQEVTVGLAARAFKFITYSESSATFEQAGIKESQIANVLVQILRKHIPTC